MTIFLLKPLDLGHKILPVGAIVTLEQGTAESLIDAGAARLSFPGESEFLKTKIKKGKHEDKATENKAAERKDVPTGGNP